MKLGARNEWVRNYPNQTRREHYFEYFANGGIFVRKPYERYFERIGIRNRYGIGPKPWRPGRYRTAKWEPYYGHGCFSGLGEISRGAYYAARYTGVAITPEMYIRDHGSEEEYQALLRRNYRQRSWVCQP